MRLQRKLGRSSLLKMQLLVQMSELALMVQELLCYLPG